MNSSLVAGCKEELYAFHGTHEGNISLIVEEGNVIYCNKKIILCKRIGMKLEIRNNLWSAFVRPFNPYAYLLKLISSKEAIHKYSSDLLSRRPVYLSIATNIEPCILIHINVIKPNM